VFERPANINLRICSIEKKKEAPDMGGGGGKGQERARGNNEGRGGLGRPSSLPSLPAFSGSYTWQARKGAGVLPGGGET